MGGEVGRLVGRRISTTNPPSGTQPSESQPAFIPVSPEEEAEEEEEKEGERREEGGGRKEEGGGLFCVLCPSSRCLGFVCFDVFSFVPQLVFLLLSHPAALLYPVLSLVEVATVGLIIVVCRRSRSSSVVVACNIYIEPKAIL